MTQSQLPRERAAKIRAAFVLISQAGEGWETTAYNSDQLAEALYLLRHLLRELEPTQ